MDQLTTDVARFFELVSGIQIRARRTIETGLRARDLTYAQYSALFALAANDGMSQAELAQALDTDSTTAMVLRTSLERKRFVTRVDDPEDGRVKRIEITESGKAALQSALPEAKSLYSKASALFSEVDLKRILPVLERLHGFVGETSATKKASGGGSQAGKGKPKKAAAPSRGGKKAPAAKAKARAKPVAAKKPAPKAVARPAPKATKSVKAAKNSKQVKVAARVKAPSGAKASASKAKAPAKKGK